MRDRMGLFFWQAFRGKRDKGVLIITAYRVCQEASDNPGPYTAYAQQHAMLRSEGVERPNPRKQLLRDLLKLIQDKRREGFRPIVMMDTN